MKRLIINADDFGICESVNRGIIDCFSYGLVSDLSFIVNSDCFDSSVALLKEKGITEVGIHFNLTMGKPNLISNNSLTDNSGNFVKAKTLFRNFITGSLNDEEIYQELKFQLDKILATGIKISHFDSHQNIHLIPQIFRQFERLKREYNLDISTRIPLEKISDPLEIKFSNLRRIMILNLLSKLTIRNSEYVSAVKTIGGDFFNNPKPGNVFERVVNALKGNDQETYEIAVHPGYYSDEILKYDQYARERENELQFLESYKKGDFAERILITSFDKM